MERSFLIKKELCHTNKKQARFMRRQARIFLDVLSVSFTERIHLSDANIKKVCVFGDITELRVKEICALLFLPFYIRKKTRNLWMRMYGEV